MSTKREIKQEAKPKQQDEGHKNVLQSGDYTMFTDCYKQHLSNSTNTLNLC